MKTRRTLNIQHPTSNIEQKRMRAVPGSMFDVQRSMFDVRIQSHTRGGFSFAEVMFAVVILGIGFIMVAAVFPVAIHQTQSTGEENSAANAARAAATAIASMPSVQPYLLYDSTYVPPALPTVDPTPYKTVKQIYVFPPTVKNYVLGTAPLAVAPPAVVVPFVGFRWDQIKANLISSLDPRYSYVPFYRRENNSPVAELIMIAVTNRNHAIYNSSDVQNSTVQTQSVPKTQYTNVMVTTQLDAYQAQILNTQIFPDSISLTNPSNSPTIDGATINVLDTAVPAPVPAPAPPAPLFPTIKTYVIGRSVAVPANSFELCAPDGMALTAGTNGLWGAGGTAIPDPPVNPANMSCTFNLPTTLQPAVAYAQLVASPGIPSGEIEFFPAAGTVHGIPPAAVPGAFVIVGDDYPLDITMPNTLSYNLQLNSVASATTMAYQVGALNGRIFRLGQPVAPSVTPQIPVGTFLLDPAYGMRPGGLNSPDMYPPIPPSALIAPPIPLASVMKVYIIGAGTAGNTTTSNSGAAQDMGIFATYIQVQ